MYPLPAEDEKTEAQRLRLSYNYTDLVSKPKFSDPEGLTLASTTADFSKLSVLSSCLRPIPNLSLMLL